MTSAPAALALLLGFGSCALRAEATPQELYLLYCSGCHGSDGRGMPPAIPDLHAALPRIASEQAVRAYALRVPGVSMSTASSEQLVTILNWMVPAFAPEAGPFQAFTLAEVRQAQQTPLTDPYAVRNQLIHDDYTRPSEPSP